MDSPNQNGVPAAKWQATGGRHGPVDFNDRLICVLWLLTFFNGREKFISYMFGRSAHSFRSVSIC